jgi:cation transporter-like permease
MRCSLLPLAVRTIPLNLIDATALLDADSYLSPCFVGFIGIPGGTGSILVSRLSTAWHAATSAIPNTPTASAGAGVSIAQSRRPRHAEPSPHTVMLVLLLVAMPVGLVYFLVLRISSWLAASFTFSMLALIFLCIAVRLPSTLHSTHLPLNYFFGRSPCR